MIPRLHRLLQTARRVLLAGAVGLATVRADDAPKPWKVGAYASLTGSEATWGQSYERGSRLAIDEINAAGGVLGRPLELVIDDNRSKSGDSATIVRKLISRDKVIAVLGEVSSGRSLEAAPFCQQMRIPMISNGSNPKVTEVGDYIFRVAYIDPFQGAVMARFAREHLHITRVGLLTDTTNAYAVGLGRFFKERFMHEGGIVALEQRYSGSERDFKAQLTALRAASVDAIFVPGYYTEVGLIAVQARELGFRGPILGGDGWASPQLAELAGAALHDTYYCDNFSLESNDPVTRRFIERYRARYQVDPDSIAPLAYDAVALLADALTRAGSAQPAKLRQALATTSGFAGVSGSLTIDAKRNPQKPAYVVGFRDGQYRLVTTIAP